MQAVFPLQALYAWASRTLTWRLLGVGKMRVTVAGLTQPSLGVLRAVGKGVGARAWCARREPAIRVHIDRYPAEAQHWR